MKTILLTLALALTIVAADLEPPRIIGARVDRSNAGQGVVVAELFIIHPEQQAVQVLQVSDGRTNKVVTVSNDRKVVIKWSVRLGGETNHFQARALSHHEPPEMSPWSDMFTIIPSPKQP